MRQVTLDSYPSVDKHVVLHLTPAGATVSGRLLTSEEITHRVRPIPVATINTTAREVLRRCNGKMTLQGIVQQILENCNTADSENGPEQMLNGVLEFVQQALQYGILELGRISAERPTHITGSTEYFAPPHVSVELTSGCNLQCVYCYRDSGPRAAMFLPGEQLIGILKELIQDGLQSVELTGGEPLLHPQFKAILDFCVQRLKRVALLTNGTLIDKDIARQLGLHKEIILVQVDLDGSTPNLHDALRGTPGAFERTKHAIELLAEHGVNVRVAMNVTKDNLNDIENTLLLAKRLGATWFSFSPVLNFGRGRNIDTVFSVEQIQYMNNLSQRMHKEHGSFFNFLKPDVFHATFPNLRNCGAGYRAVALGPTGEVRPCPLLPEQYLVMGDLTKQSVSQVFSNPIVSKLYELEWPSEEVCGECKYTLYCRYCHTRGIVTQAELESPCEWIRANELEERVSVAANTSLASDKPCKTDTFCV
jgi:radical SAM protein with 4Fe4S-binding SPASM domain